MNPLVTIAIPTYSRVHYLKEAVARRWRRRTTRLKC